MALDHEDRPIVVKVDDVHVVYRVFEDLKISPRDRLAEQQLRGKFREVNAGQGVSF